MAVVAMRALVDAIEADWEAGRSMPIDAAEVAKIVAKFCLDQPTITLSATDALGLARRVLQHEIEIASRHQKSG